MNATWPGADVSGATVTIGGQAAGNVVVSDASTITVTTPASATSGARSVTVTTPGGGSVTLPNAFTYTAAVTGTATVTFRTTGQTCQCTRPIGGVLSNLLVDGVTLGTMGCAEPSRSFSVTPGVHTVQACDRVECWAPKTQTIAAGGEFIYTATCQ